jgi:light-regulated signal transduction histidine kinase (bacteriophytochrome)
MGNSGNLDLASRDAALESAMQHCESEAIHLIGLVQSHGLLLVLGPAPDRRILQLSDNIAKFFATTPESILGAPLAQLVGDEQAAELDEVLRNHQPGPSSSRLIYSVLDDVIVELTTTIHHHAGLDFLEMEPIRKAFDPRDVHQLFDPVRKALWELDKGGTVVEYCQIVADLVRELVNFERVMVYRFDANWEGEVIAESRVDNAVSYLGNRFPAGDIPAQARQLYARNLIRVVSDTTAAPATIIPTLNPLTGLPLDLSFSKLRAFSPVHIEYLKNMDVRASLSISIMMEGKLWGLIACHHSAPAFVPPAVREILEFVEKAISAKLTALDLSEKLTQAHRLGEAMSILFREAYRDNPAQALGRHSEQILQPLDAGGAVLVIDGKRYYFGVTPNPAQIEDLLGWLSQHPSGVCFASSHLAAQILEASAYGDVAAGLLATPVTADMQNTMLWFRPEKIRTINWAGRPDQKVVTDQHGILSISPRKSFAVWSETSRHHSLDWREGEITSGTVLAEALIARFRAR